MPLQPEERMQELLVEITEEALSGKPQEELSVFIQLKLSELPNEILREFWPLALKKGCSHLLGPILSALVSQKEFNSFFESALVEVAKEENIHAVRALVEVEGINVNKTYSADKMTALMWAGDKGNIEILRILLAHGAKDSVSEYQTPYGHTALSLAAEAGSLDCVNALLEASAETLDESDNDGVTPLMKAAALGRLDIVTVLLQKGAETSYISWNSKHAAMGVGPMTESALTRAIPTGNLPVITTLVKAGSVGLNRINFIEELIIAIKEEHLAVINYLLERQPELANATEKNNIPALSVAAVRGYTDGVRALLDAKANIHACDMGENALTCAVDGGDAATVRLLTERGAVLSAVGFTSGTPTLLLEVLESAKPKKLEFLEALIKVCRDQVNTRNIYATTALRVVIRKKEPRHHTHIYSNEDAAQLVKCLLAAGADVNAIRQEESWPYEQTALTSAVMQDREEVVRVILAHPNFDPTIDNQLERATKIVERAKEQGRNKQAIGAIIEQYKAQKQIKSIGSNVFRSVARDSQAVSPITDLTS